MGGWARKEKDVVCSSELLSNRSLDCRRPFSSEGGVSRLSHGSRKSSVKREYVMYAYPPRSQMTPTLLSSSTVRSE